MKPITRPVSGILMALAAFVSLATPNTASAVNYVWQPTGATANWNVAANWNPATHGAAWTVNTDVFDLTQAVLAQDQTITLGTDITANQLLFGSSTKRRTRSTPETSLT